MFEETLKFYQNFPKEGINFVDIMPFMQDKEVFTKLIGEIGRHVTAPTVAAPEARAFLFCAPLLTSDSGVTNVVPFRKKRQAATLGRRPAKHRDYEANMAPTISTSANPTSRPARLRMEYSRSPSSMTFWPPAAPREGIAKALDALKITVDGKEYGVKVTEFIFLAELDGLYGRNRLEKIAPVYSIAHIK